MSNFTCKICGAEWAYVIANPAGPGLEVRLCKPHYDVLMEAQSEAYKKLLETGDRK
jgi:3-hydroxyacyl-CoA dehydrogenase